MKSLAQTTKGMILLATILVFASCSKDDENPVIPVKESIAAVYAEGIFWNSVFPTATILECQLLFDGSSIATKQHALPRTSDPLVGFATSVSKGQHTVSFKIVAQTSSPTSYDVTNAAVSYNQTRIDLPNRSKSLATGDTISYTVDLR